MKKEISLPLKNGDVVGKVEYTLDGRVIGENYLEAAENVEKADYLFTLGKMVRMFLQIA